MTRIPLRCREMPCNTEVWKIAAAATHCSAARIRPQARSEAAGVRRRTAPLEAPVAWPQEASRLPMGRSNMEEVEFHGAPPAPFPTMVVAFGGWIDAGEAATGAMRYLVHQLAAT